MEKYSIYCTEEQTKKALALGAPIKKTCFALCDAWKNDTPTAEQMIGWLEEQGIMYNIATNPFNEFKVIVSKAGSCEDIAIIDWSTSRKQATLAAIDVALEYLMNNKK